MTNEQLAYAMLVTFKPFGQILSVKASRDSKGRPFGFVEFSVIVYLNYNIKICRISKALCLH